MKTFLILSFLFIITITEAATKHDIEIIKFKFSPAEITIEAGDTIRWTNKEKRQYHSVWFEQLGEKEPGYFFPDEFYERTFDKAGEFPYRCGPHPKMTGVVHVVPFEENKHSDDKKDTVKEDSTKETTHDMKKKDVEPPNPAY